ncbi:MAG: hypothetical protein U0414_27275 [Polyangiaceae bacterium]
MTKVAGALALALCLGAAACGSPDAKPAGSGSPSATATTSTKVATSAAPAKSDEPKVDVDIAKILDASKDAKTSGALKVDLSKVDENAPPIGGSAAKKDPSAKYTWIAAGDAVLIGQPQGWEKGGNEVIGQFLDAKKKATIVWRTFTDQKDGQAKVDDLVKRLSMKDPVWRDNVLKKFVLGPDKIPALMGAGNAKEPDGTPVALFYFLVQTGGKENLLIIGGVDDGAPKETLDEAIRIIDGIKKK